MTTLRFWTAARAGLAIVAVSAGLPAYAADPALPAFAAPSASPPVPALPAPDPARLALGRQIVAIMSPPEKREAIMTSMLDSMLAQFRAGTRMPPGFEDPGLKQIMDLAFASLPGRVMPIIRAHLPAMQESVARSYAREFSTGELNDIIGFAKTPAGQRWFQRSPAVMSSPDVGAANTAYFRDLQGASRQISVELQRQVSDYLGKHPDIAARLKTMPH